MVDVEGRGRTGVYSGILEPGHTGYSVFSYSISCFVYVFYGTWEHDYIFIVEL